MNSDPVKTGLLKEQRARGGEWKWLPICSHFVPVIRSRPSFPVDEIINSRGQTARSSVSWFMARGEKSVQPGITEHG